MVTIYLLLSACLVYHLVKLVVQQQYAYLASLIIHSLLQLVFLTRVIKHAKHALNQIMHLLAHLVTQILIFHQENVFSVLLHAILVLLLLYHLVHLALQIIKQHQFLSLFHAIQYVTHLV